jgi:hypothetical protein
MRHRRVEISHAFPLISFPLSGPRGMLVLRLVAAPAATRRMQATPLVLVACIRLRRAGLTTVVASRALVTGLATKCRRQADNEVAVNTSIASERERVPRNRSASIGHKVLRRNAESLELRDSDVLLALCHNVRRQRF